MERRSHVRPLYLHPALSQSRFIVSGAPPGGTVNYLLHLIVLIEIYVMLSLSLNLMVGYTGLLSLAQAAFYGIGAYLTSLLMISAGFSFVTALVVSAIG